MSIVLFDEQYFLLNYSLCADNIKNCNKQENLHSYSAYKILEEAFNKQKNTIKKINQIEKNSFETEKFTTLKSMT